ncbi:hypothetical protein CN378_20845 [Bacillus sp. AFS015802]|uniref:DUF1499 domain-containing protein n=1 Tax=Bacillus sp. AFS015802 TaxID=2033486 RepID=UPI000BF46FB0|nr:DUF1499 domain-containing protein [Bacillus sp. AFS015802]PFA62411.1 hypothetical protein CN378_20845 [Bacillus sp. AFS015802]
METVPFTHCPTNKKNCVSTIDLTSYHRIAPLPISGGVEDAKAKIHRTLSQFDSVEIKEEESHYVHAVFTSKWLKFKDDLELYIDESTHLLHFKSGSRLGYYDFKVNRKRVERFKSLFTKE